MALGPQSQQRAPQEELQFAPAVPFAIADMPKGQLDDFEGGPIDAKWILFDYGDQSEYGIQFAARIKFRTEDGDEGEEVYPAGDLRYFRPVLPPGITLPPGYYDDKTKKYYIDGLKGATPEQLETYSSDRYLSAINAKSGKQFVFGQNKKFGQLIAKAQTEGWPYDENLLCQSLSAFVRTMHGHWNRVSKAINQKEDKNVGGGLAAEAAAGAGKGGGNRASKTLLLTQYVPPSPAWLASLPTSPGGVVMPQPGWVAPQPPPMQPVQMPPGMAVMPAVAPSMPAVAAPPVPPAAAPTGGPIPLDLLVPQLATQALAQHPKGTAVPHNILAMAVMQGAKAQGQDPTPAWHLFSDRARLTAWAPQYGWVYDPGANTLTSVG